MVKCIARRRNAEMVSPSQDKEVRFRHPSFRKGQAIGSFQKKAPGRYGPTYIDQFVGATDSQDGQRSANAGQGQVESYVRTRRGRLMNLHGKHVGSVQQERWINVRRIAGRFIGTGHAVQRRRQIHTLLNRTRSP